MIFIKTLICSGLLGTLFTFASDLAWISGWPKEYFPFWLLFTLGFLLGGYLARYVSWGWLLGGGAGLIAGFYGLLLPLAMFWPAKPYEDVLGLLCLGAGVGVIVGGYSLSRFFTAHAGR